MKALETGRLAVWAAIAFGVLTVVVGVGLAWRFELLMPSWWRYWDRPELLYPEELTKPIHARIPQELPSTPTPTMTSSPTPNAKTPPSPTMVVTIGFDQETPPTPIEPRRVAVAPTNTSPLPTKTPTATHTETTTPLPTNTFTWTETATPSPTFTLRPRLRPGTVFFWEDFSKTPEGLLPEGWVGGEHLSVITDGGTRTLQPFQYSKEHRLQTASVAFWPDDFRVEWVLGAGQGDDRISGRFTLQISNLSVYLGTRSFGEATFQINDSKKQLERFRKSLVRLAVEKRGLVVKGFVDDVEVLVLRLEEFPIPRQMTFSAERTSRFSLRQILATAL